MNAHVWIEKGVISGYLAELIPPPPTAKIKMLPAVKKNH